MVVAIHAVLAAGGAYVPIDPEQPDERIAYVLDIADPLLVLSASGEVIDTDRTVVFTDTLDVSDQPTAVVTDADRLAPLRPENAAYVLFTSGSTGRPKGVTVSHRAVVNQLSWMQSKFGVDASDSVFLKTPATFDASAWELLLPFVSGARMVVAGPDGHRDPVYLAGVLVSGEVSVAQFVPSVLDAVLDELDGPAGALRLVFSGGEALSGATARRVRSLCGADVHNLYGPTEVTMQATHRVADEVAGTQVPIGTTVWNTDAWVLDVRMQPVRSGWSVSCICRVISWRGDMRVVRS